MQIPGLETGLAWRPAVEYKSNCAEWWVGRRVRLRRDLWTCGGKLFRRGRIARVERKYGGLTLIGTKGMHVTRVGYWGIEVDTSDTSLKRTVAAG